MNNTQQSEEAETPRGVAETQGEKTMGLEMHKNDLFDLGYEMRTTALAAHDGFLPDIKIAWFFALENPELFTDSEEWPEVMPAEPPAAVKAGYYDEPMLAV